jgi:hypothetical protein
MLLRISWIVNYITLPILILRYIRLFSRLNVAKHFVVNALVSIFDDNLPNINRYSPIIILIGIS